MLLQEITLHNFGGYRGRHEIHLAPPGPDQPIVLFGGLNGAGKTTLLDALQLVLYGKRARCSGRGNLAYDEYLRRSINRAVQGREGAALELRFVAPFDGSSSQFRVQRSWDQNKRSIKEHLAVSRDGVHSQLLTERWDEIVEELMPLEIASLFFFDGEKIEALADPDRAARVIGTAIESLLGLGLLQRLQTDLVALERKKRSITVDSDARRQLEALEDEVRAASELKSVALQDQAARLNDVDRAESAANAAKEAFRQHGGELFDRKNELEQHHSVLTEQLGEVDSQLLELAAGSLPLRLVGHLLQQVKDQRKLELGAEHAALLAADLVDRDNDMLAAIGDALPPDARARLDRFLSADRQRKAELAKVTRYLEAAGEVDQRLSFVWPNEIDRAAKQTEGLLDRRRALQAEIDEIERMLAAVPAAAAVAELSVQSLGAERVLSDARARFQLASETALTADRSLQTVIAKQDRIERELTHLLEAEEEARRVVDHAARVRDTIAEFRRALIARHLNRIEPAVLDSLQRLLRKQRLIDDLRLDPETFQLSLFDSEARLISPDRLSAGERQLLAVALLWGLARVSGRQLPTIIDTPLGRLDSTHRRLIAERYFPNASHQVLLLSTDEEIDESLLEIIQPAVGRSYELRYDDATSSTSVFDGYFMTTEEVCHVA
jgi:DNA sulfur modification protein DndD